MRQSAAKLLKTGHIYMITTPSGKHYIGQHNSNNYMERKNTHIYRYITFLKKKCILELNKKFYPAKKFPQNPSGFCTALYCAFQKYGVKNCLWTILETDIPLDELNDVEDQYIIKYNTLVPNGYNLKLNKNNIGGFCYSEESRNKMSISQSIAIVNNLHKYRKKHHELQGVPQFVTYFESGGIRGYRINKHPNCKFKQFADADTPILELKEKMLNFLKKCEVDKYITVQDKKIQKGIPKGISEQKPGKFLVQFTYKGKKYNKFFSAEPGERALKEATIWMQNKRKELKEEGSETK